MNQEQTDTSEITSTIVDYYFSSIASVMESSGESDNIPCIKICIYFKARVYNSEPKVADTITSANSEPTHCSHLHLNLRLDWLIF